MPAARGVCVVRVRVEVRLKKGVADPEGDNVRKALTLLGFKGLHGVHSSKVFLIDLATKDPKAARKDAEEMCRRLLANPVIHDYAIVVEK
ncbi:MAG: phosphoribosylformylglycinamidine synthase subunit PurS [Thermoplasmata archaeon]